MHLGLCIDKFNPFGSFVAPYSYWLVILTIYNLSPSMCIRLEFIFLSTVIVGPNSPGQNINVYLRLLIDGIKHLWSSRALTYDVSKKHNFFMKTALIWIFNDFPAYEMVSSWNTHEKLVCSYCMENSKAFTLTNNSKNIFFSLSQAVLTNGSQIQKKHKRLFCWQS